MSEELKELEAQYKQELDKLAKNNENADGNNVKTNEAIKKMDKKFDELETLNQKMLADENEKARAYDEKMASLESAIARGSEKSDKVEASEAIKAYEQFLMKGSDKLSDIELKYLRTDLAVDGGVLCPTEILVGMIKKITEISPIRQLAKVTRVSDVTARAYKRNTLVTVGWGGEGVAATASNSKYGASEIDLHGLKGEVKISNKALLQSSFNFQQEINSDLIEAFAKTEGAAFISGNGVDKPYGFMENSSIGSTESSGGVVSFDSLIDVTGELKTGYNPIYGMNRKTIAAIRKLKDGNGQYLWQAGNVAAGIPNTINGYAYYEMPDLDDIAIDAYPIIFGDFAKGYQIVDGASMIMQRNPFRASGFVIFETEKFVGGDVILAEAFQKIKVTT